MPTFYIIHNGSELEINYKHDKTENSIENLEFKIIDDSKINLINQPKEEDIIQLCWDNEERLIKQYKEEYQAWVHHHD
jgi:hypothetical protein